MPPDPIPVPERPAPVVADTAKCRAAAKAFIDSVTEGQATPAARYRYLAHSFSFVKAAVGKAREEATAARVAFEKERDEAITANKAAEGSST